jgi:hypothetical protein
VANDRSPVLGKPIACHGDHRAGICIKIYSEEAEYPEDIPDVLGVAIGGISRSPAYEDGNGKNVRARATILERDFVVVRPLANFYFMKLAKSRLVMPVQTVDATPCITLIRQSFQER